MCGIWCLKSLSTNAKIILKNGITIFCGCFFGLLELWPGYLVSLVPVAVCLVRVSPCL